MCGNTKVSLCGYILFALVMFVYLVYGYCTLWCVIVFI